MSIAGRLCSSSTLASTLTSCTLTRIRPRCSWPAGGSSAGIGCTIGGGFVDAVEAAVFVDAFPVFEPEFFVELAPALFEPFLFFRAQGGRSVCCAGGGGVG